MLVAFDFDGTLSADEMVVLLGEHAGRAGEIAAITERAMEGELSYGESLRERATLLSGLSESDVAAAYDRVHLREGAADLLAALSAAGTRTAILTGGFEAGIERVLAREGVSVDRIVANRLETEDGALTGGVSGPLVEGTKDEALRSVAAEFGVDLSETVAVGDGANDLPMLSVAGTAVGFRPKSAVRGRCDVVVATVERLREALREAGAVAE